MSKPWTKLALSSLLFLAVGGAPIDAHEIASNSDPADPLCGQGQLRGQYECTTSVPLSEEEVRVSLAYLASFKPADDVSPAALVVDAREHTRRD
jgi:hypothetical protein